MAEEFHVSSLVVHCRREHAGTAAAAIEAMEGLEVHGGIAEGKLVVTLETTSEAAIVERLNAIQVMDGVLAATLVFHHAEPIEPCEAIPGSRTP
ncbi:chaperone NapD [Roseicella aquatilis]|uniref:chaperone NapD n=1 Tax=Roseicella aquatilis TaxID=2527868 RepID=UPI0014054C6A|nr:chaperone NapD [Roseicella aquatilis]